MVSPGWRPAFTCRQEAPQQRVKQAGSPGNSPASNSARHAKNWSSPKSLEAANLASQGLSYLSFGNERGNSLLPRVRRLRARDPRTAWAGREPRPGTASAEGAKLGQLLEQRGIGFECRAEQPGALAPSCSVIRVSAWGAALRRGELFPPGALGGVPTPSRRTGAGRRG